MIYVASGNSTLEKLIPHIRTDTEQGRQFLEHLKMGVLTHREMWLATLGVICLSKESEDDCRKKTT